MKWTGMCCIIFSLLLTGCATTARFMGLATIKDMDQKLAVRDTRLDGADRNIQDLGKTDRDIGDGLERNQQLIDEAVARLTSIDTEMDVIRNRAREIEGLVDEFLVLKKTTEDLSVYAEQIKVRLDNLPKETIEELVTVLQAYLSAGVPPAAVQAP